jgi:glycosyltransferase involved in cell wall biosynthesis
MHVLFEELSTPQRAGGIEAATRGLITALAGLGVRVTRRFADVPQAIDAVPDCVHIHGIWSPTLARRFIHWRRLGVPCVVTVHGMLEPWALAHKRLKKQVAWHIYQKRLLNRASALHATSPREADNLRRLGLKPPVATIPWGVDVPGEDGSRIVDRGLRIAEEDQMHGAPASPSSIPHPLPPIHYSPSSPTSDLRPPTSDLRPPSPDLRPPSSDLRPLTSDLRPPSSDLRPPTSGLKTALFVGRIYPVKGLPLLVEAWAKVRPAGWKMRVVGPDEAGHRAEVEALVRQAGLEDAFEFTGPLEGEALRHAYADAELLVLPSHTENFGMVVAEALAHGLPVIATRGSPWKLLEDERCGWWVPVSADGIAAALDDATRRTSADLSAMGGRGRVVVAERFAWDGIARQFLACYQWLLGNGPQPGCIGGKTQDTL